jgi:hypothetical protein
MRRKSTMQADSIIKTLLLAAILAALSPPLSVQSPDSRKSLQPPQIQMNAVAAAAKRDFAQFVQYNVQIRSGTLPAGFPLGVADVRNLKDARIAYGFPIYSIDPQDIVTGRSDFSAMAKPTGSWRFIRVFQAQSDFLEVASASGHARFAPLSSATDGATAAATSWSVAVIRT